MEMKAMRKIILLLFIAAVMTGCNIDYLSEALNSYDEDISGLEISWNADNTIRTAKDPETGDVVWYETWEYDVDSSNPILVQRYSPEGRLKWSTLYKWSDGLKIQEVCYDSANNLLWHSFFTYNSDGLMLCECNYDSDNSLQWFNVWEYSGELKINQGRYDGRSVMTNAFTWEYNGDGEWIKETSYSGNSSRSIARNSAGLAYPVAGTVPVLPSFSLAGMTMSNWRMKTIDTNGSFIMSFDSENYPTELFRTDSRLTRDVTVKIDYYSGHIPKSKLTKYGNDEVLYLELSYNSYGYLSEINTSGKALIIPLRYTIDYNADLSPERVSVYQADTKLMYFVYESAPKTDLTAVHPLDPVNFTGQIHTITQYDGGDVKLGSYEFTTDIVLNQIKIQAKKADGSENGHFIAALDTDDEITSFEAWSDDGVMLWHYNYDYTEVAGEIMRTAEEKYDDIKDTVEDYTSIDITTLSLDLLFN
jgi:hypothetical protein